MQIDAQTLAADALRPHLEAYCAAFAVPMSRLLPHRFYALTPNTARPYRQLYAMACRRGKGSSPASFPRASSGIIEATNRKGGAPWDLR